MSFNYNYNHLSERHHCCKIKKTLKIRTVVNDSIEPLVRLLTGVIESYNGVHSRV